MLLSGPNTNTVAHDSALLLPTGATGVVFSMLQTRTFWSFKTKVIDIVKRGTIANVGHYMNESYFFIPYVLPRHLLPVKSWTMFELIQHTNPVVLSVHYITQNESQRSTFDQTPRWRDWKDEDSLNTGRRKVDVDVEYYGSRAKSMLSLCGDDYQKFRAACSGRTTQYKRIYIVT